MGVALRQRRANGIQRPERARTGTSRSWIPKAAARRRLPWAPYQSSSQRSAVTGAKWPTPWRMASVRDSYPHARCDGVTEGVRRVHGTMGLVVHRRGAACTARDCRGRSEWSVRQQERTPCSSILNTACTYHGFLRTTDGSCSRRSRRVLAPTASCFSHRSAERSPSPRASGGSSPTVRRSTPRRPGGRRMAARFYLHVRADGFRCLWAQRLHPMTAHPVGAPFEVQPFHQANVRSMPLWQPGAAGTALGGTRLPSAWPKPRATSGWRRSSEPKGMPRR